MKLSKTLSHKSCFTLETLKYSKIVQNLDLLFILLLILIVKMNESSYGADCFSALVFLPHYSAFHQVKQFKK